MHTGDYDSAYIEFQLTSTQTSDPELVVSSLLGMGRALLQKKDYSGAYSQFTFLLNNYPASETRDRSYFFLAKAYEALDQPRLAADAYISYLDAISGVLDSEINEMLGDAFIEDGDYASAVSAYETSLTNVSANAYDALQIKLAQAVSLAGNNDQAISIYLSLLETSQSSYTKSQSNFLLGQIYYSMGMPEQAYARFQDNVMKYPEYYDSYSGLVTLVNDGQSVDLLQRGITDYYAEQYGVAATTLEEYILTNPNHTAEAHYYKALSLYETGDYEAEIAQWDEVIAEHSYETDYYYSAFDEKSYTQWLAMNEFQQAAETCLTYVASVPTSPDAPLMLDKAARIYVDGGYLVNGAQAYERLFNEYPGSEKAYPGLFKAGILYYRAQDYKKAQLTFQRLIVLTENPSEIAAANLWVAKSLEKQGDLSQAAEYYHKAANADPDGYYGLRANQIINGQSPFPSIQNIDLGIDLASERQKADRWMRNTFQLDLNVDLSSFAELTANTHWQRAETFYLLDMREEARLEYEALRVSLEGDALNTYRLLKRLVERGFYNSATYASRHILDLAGLSQSETLTVPPVYFNHIRFGTFYREIIVSTALEHGIDPMLIFSLIRQESMFDSSITSSAGAIGLMQMLPDTGAETADLYGWPQNFSAADLNRPMINVRLGTHYFRRWLDYYDGSYYAALSSYNAGPNYTMRYVELSGGDIDFFLELLTKSETRDYIMSIVENFQIYENIYSRE